MNLLKRTKFFKNLKFRTKVELTSLKNLKLRVKLIGGFIFLVLLTSLFSIVSTRLTFQKITEDSIPTLVITGQTSDLVQTLQVEILEFVASNEEGGLAQFEANSSGLNTLAEQLNDLADDPDEGATFENFAGLVQKVPPLGQEIIQSHRQTLERLEELQGIEEATKVVFDKVNEIIDAEVARNIAAGDLDELQKDSILSKEYLAEFTDAVQSLHLEALEFAASGQAEAAQEFEDAKSKLEVSQENLAEILEPDEPGEADLLLRLDEVGKQFEATGTEVIASHTKTLALLEELADLEGEVDSAATATQQLADQDVSRGEARADTNLIIGSLVMVVLAISLGFVVTNTVVKPVYQLVEAAKQIGAGDLTVQARVDTQDEIGELANSFNQMTDDLRQRIEAEQEANKKATQLAQEAEQAGKKATQLAEAEREAKEHLEQTVDGYLAFIEQVASGDLTARLSLNGSDDALATLGRNLNTMVESLGEMTSQIREATASISSAAAEILAATSQQASSANEQSSAISQTSTTIDEVKTIVEQNYGKAQGVAEQARQARDISHNGQQAVTETVESMSQIKERVEGIAENILALSEQTQQIGDITATVNEIASQSNLLALNASVEAARAGEHGKGFAVVAVEVRNLAEQSKQATAQVKAILNEIQRATNAAVMATEEGTKGVDAGVQLTGQAGGTIQKLASSISESAKAAQQIVASAQQQTTGMEQIALAMENINQATIQNLASTRQAEKSAQDLSSVAQQLESVVARYKLN